MLEYCGVGECHGPVAGNRCICGRRNARKLPGLDVDALRALQDEELATALADLDCYDAHVRDVYEPLRNAFETELMDEFGDELDALRSIGQ